MVAVFRMSAEKKDKWTKKIEKMIALLEEFKECLEDSEDYDGDEDWEDAEEPQFKAMMKRAMKKAMKSRYSRKNYDV